MKEIIPQILKNLVQNLGKPLYLTGGMVRNKIMGASTGEDFDIAAPVRLGELADAVRLTDGLKLKCVYPRTNTARLTDGEHIFEFSSFRKETYAEGGAHTPRSVSYTSDIREDALRRDFKCNAVYYDIANDKIADPLGGAEDMKNGIISSVAEGGEVFKNDGLRLLRLCRLSGELNLVPDAETLAGAKKYAGNIADISEERITAELKKMLVCDKKYTLSSKTAHYDSFKLAKKIGILDYIFPELMSGEGIAQRPDFHKYDVLEHSFRALLYAEPEVRLAALLHDVGKPVCFAEYGNFHRHDEAGAQLCEDILGRLKFPRSEIKECVRLVALHMCDLRGEDRPNKIRAVIVKNADLIDKLMALKNADYSACKDDLRECPTVTKWKKIYAEMKSEGTPFTVKELNIKAKKLISEGFFGREIGDALDYLLTECIYNPSLNTEEKLLAAALRNRDLRRKQGLK